MNIFNATCISRIAFRTPLHSYFYYLSKQYFPAKMSGTCFPFVYSNVSSEKY